jgi:uncharacterized repeat protein (TIGR01451 family)
VGTDIKNDVTVNFTVGTSAQTAEAASNTFDVDRKIIFTLLEAATTGTTSVSPNEQDAVTRFQLTNTSNDTLDFNLAAAQLSGGTAEHGGTDNFDVANLQYFVDSNGDGIYQVGSDTATTVNNLAPDSNVYIFVVGDIPISRVSGDVAGVTLTATARNSSDGSAITDVGGLNTAGIESVFADAGNDGVESDGDDYTVSAADLTVTKLSRVVSDGVSGSNPKAIPGAFVEYCIVVTNSGTATAPASNVAVSDDLALLTDITYDSTFQAKIDGTVVSGDTCTAGATNANYTGGTNGIVSGTLTDIAPGQTRTLVFRVTID